MSRTLTAGESLTHEHWIAAGRRALTRGITVRQISGGDQWIAASGSNPDIAYALTLGDGGVVSCSCPAQTWGTPVCSHMGALALRLGTLTLPLDDVAGDAGELGA